MQIFFSHSSAQKPLIRELRKILPEHINGWVDEQRLLIGDCINETLEAAIKKETDFLLLFVDELSVKSEWVEREIKWTLDQERRLERVILLPIVVDFQAWVTIKPTVLRDRKYLKLEDYTEDGVRSLGKRITSELFSLICRDIQILRSPRAITKTSVLDRTDQVLSKIASAIREAVFGHREWNPMTVPALHNALSTVQDLEYNQEDFEALMRKIIQNGFIPGLVYDGYELYLQEEHYKWKSQMFVSAKKQIAKAAATMIKSGQKIAIDAGSTTDELARILCFKVESKSLWNITIVTNALSIANQFLESAKRLGFDDENTAFDLYFAGGKVRPNTQATVPISSETSLEYIFHSVGGVDTCFVGVNGIHAKAGFTTHNHGEAINKRTLLKNSKKTVILGDKTKMGIVESACFANWDNDILLITDGDYRNANEALALYKDKIIVV